MRRDTVILLKNFLLCSRYDQQVFISVSKSEILFCICFCYAPMEIHFPNFFHVKVTSLFKKLSYFVLRLTSLIPPKFIPSKHFPLHDLHDLLHTGNVNDGGCAGINFTLMEHFAGGVDQQKLFKTKISSVLKYLHKYPSTFPGSSLRPYPVHPVFPPDLSASPLNLSVSPLVAPDLSS
jgi:hypothetical protein